MPKAEDKSGEVARKDLSLYLNLRHDISTRDFHELAPLDYPAYQRFFSRAEGRGHERRRRKKKPFAFARVTFYRGSLAREAPVGQSLILIEYGQPLFFWLSRD